MIAQSVLLCLLQTLNEIKPFQISASLLKPFEWSQHNKILKSLYVGDQLQIDTTDNEDYPMNYIDRNYVQTDVDCENPFNPNEEIRSNEEK